MGKKKRRRDSLDRVYKGDYIGCPAHPAMTHVITAAQQRRILFAGETLKINERFVM